MLPLYDAHAHLADSRLQDSLPEILQDCRAHGVKGILANAAHLSEWTTIVTLGEQPDIHPAIGLHPFFIDEWTDDCPARLEQALLDTPAASVGEIGLDAWSSRDALPKQKEDMVGLLRSSQGAPHHGAPWRLPSFHRKPRNRQKALGPRALSFLLRPRHLSGRATDPRRRHLRATRQNPVGNGLPRPPATALQRAIVASMACAIRRRNACGTAPHHRSAHGRAD